MLETVFGVWLIKLGNFSCKRCQKTNLDDRLYFLREILRLKEMLRNNKTKVNMMIKRIKTNICHLEKRKGILIRSKIVLCLVVGVK